MNLNYFYPVIKFREDLYYRIKVVQIHLPPLRTRGNDLDDLIAHFLDVYTRKHGCSIEGISKEAMVRLQNHNWPGNVRELENCMEGAVVLAHGGSIDSEHLGLPGVVDKPQKPDELWSLAVVERAHVLKVLKSVGGCRGKAAILLGIGRNTLTRKLNKWVVH